MAYVAAGFSPDRFWELTPREYVLHMRGAARRVERETAERMWLAWHVGAFGRAAKMPRLADVMPKPSTRRRQSPEEMEAALRAWQIALEPRQ